MLIAPRLARWATASFLFLSAALLPHTQSGASIVQHALARLETVGEGPLHWTPCFNSSAPEQTRWRCGFLDVPLDHTNASDPRTARIAMVMLRARNETSKRTLFLDPGGPGGSGTAYAFARSDFWETITDGNYNILGFDARGVNMSSPQASCYEDNFNRMPWWLSASPDLSRTDPEAQFEIADS
ncbi:hypothetical protein OC842_007398 [Tilletia horrida]|uniref:AB hydrolase-1 domain-containing protein n=1 Tax=Tilletia horrida TaxID=155126 RepID=A0AAN6G663_9BASI|nr:hypothetical protein OC842_007398 [Tilletia horrida]